jgi:hypothetical protein
MAKARFSPSNPGPVAQSFARYIEANLSETYPELKSMTPAIAQAFFSFHGEWQDWRNQAGGEAEQEAAVRNERKAEELRATQAKKIEAAKKLLAEAGVLPAETKQEAKKTA